MGASTNRDFASFLDELIASEEESERTQAAAPSLRVDFLDQIERIQSASPVFAGEPAIAQYREVALTLDEVAGRVGAAEALPAIEADAIADELGIGRFTNSEELGRLRRLFAMHNHPDRVPSHLRERALIRMQVANRLIDEAKNRSSRKRSRH